MDQWLKRRYEDLFSQPKAVLSTFTITKTNETDILESYLNHKRDNCPPKELDN